MAVSGLRPTDITSISGVFEKGKDKAKMCRNRLFINLISGLSNFAFRQLSSLALPNVRSMCPETI